MRKSSIIVICSFSILLTVCHAWTFDQNSGDDIHKLRQELKAVKQELFVSQKEVNKLKEDLSNKGQEISDFKAVLDSGAKYSCKVTDLLRGNKQENIELELKVNRMSTFITDSKADLYPIQGGTPPIAYSFSVAPIQSQWLFQYSRRGDPPVSSYSIREKFGPFPIVITARQADGLPYEIAGSSLRMPSYNYGGFTYSELFSEFPGIIKFLDTSTSTMGLQIFEVVCNKK